MFRVRYLVRTSHVSSSDNKPSPLEGDTALYAGSRLAVTVIAAWNLLTPAARTQMLHPVTMMSLETCTLCVLASEPWSSTPPLIRGPCAHPVSHFSLRTFVPGLGHHLFSGRTAGVNMVIAQLSCLDLGDVQVIPLDKDDYSTNILLYALDYGISTSPQQQRAKRQRQPFRQFLATIFRRRPFWPLKYALRRTRQCVNIWYERLGHPNG